MPLAQHGGLFMRWWRSHHLVSCGVDVTFRLIGYFFVQSLWLSNNSLGEKLPLGVWLPVTLPLQSLEFSDQVAEWPL